MIINNPLNSIPQGKKLAVFLWLLGATLATSVIMRMIGPFAPNIVDYEFANTAAKAAGVINAWDALAKLRACFNLGFDFLYMPVYSTTIALACVMGAGVLAAKGWRNLGMLLAWGLWLAAILDAVENYALITMMFNGASDPYPMISAFCATCKFSLILLGLFYALVSLIIYLVKRMSVARITGKNA